MTEDPVKLVEKQLHNIIDELHPLFTAISDEELIDECSECGTFERSFLHQTGKRFLMRWKVYYGTPETVRTVFEPATQL